MSSASNNSGNTFRRGIARLARAANMGITPFDEILFAPRAYDRVGPLFIIGAPRSGTTLTFQVLAQALRISYLPSLLDNAYGLTNLTFRLLGGRLRRPRPIYQSSAGKTPGLLSPSEAFGYWSRWLSKEGHSRPVHGSKDALTRLPPIQASSLRTSVHVTQGHLSAPLLVKCLYLSLAVTALSEAMPDARFLLVMRDPLATAASLLRIRQQTPTAWWSVRPPGYRTKLDEPIVDQVVWQLAETMRTCRQSLDALGVDRWRIIRFEELCANPRRSVTGITGWLTPLGYETRGNIDLPDAFALPSPPSDKEVSMFERSPYYRDMWSSYS